MGRAEGRATLREKEMDGRGRCPFFSESTNAARNIEQRKHIYCEEGAQDGMSLAVGFRTKAMREEWRKNFCNCKYEDCPYYWVASEKYEM